MIVYIVIIVFKKNLILRGIYKIPKFISAILYKIPKFF